jgi:Holliday junction resolvase
VSGKPSRDKGAAAEREVVRILRDAGWPDAVRTSDGRAQDGRGDVLKGPDGFHIEIKRQERLNVPAAMLQATEDAGGELIPIVVHRPSRQQWMVTVDLRVFLGLLIDEDQA